MPSKTEEQVEQLEELECQPEVIGEQLDIDYGEKNPQGTSVKFADLAPHLPTHAELHEICRKASSFRIYPKPLKSHNIFWG